MQGSSPGPDKYFSLTVIITEPIRILYMVNNKNPRHKSHQGPGAYQPAAGLIFTCLQTNMNNYPVSLQETCGQQVESPSHCWLLYTV